jgi:hypothetical protein
MKFKIIFALAEENDKHDINPKSMSENELKEEAKKMGIEVNPSMDKHDIARAIKNKKRETRSA